jgi:6-pyruvoyltetrahydropterin/6-carboxytetrahydropterin synthase
MTEFSVTISTSWPMGHRLQSHAGKCRHLHGHTYKLEATFIGHPNDAPGTSTDGMVADFSALKACLALVVGDYDHAMVLERGDPAADACHAYSRLHVVNFPPTAERLAAWFMSGIAGELQRIRISVRCARVRLWESEATYAEVTRS